MSWYHTRVGEHREALGHGYRALELYQEVGTWAGEADAWHTLAYAHFQGGDHRRALICYQRAQELDRRLGHSFNEAETLARVAETQLALGDVPAARHAWRQALAIFEELHHPDAERVRDRLAALDAAPPTDPGRSAVRPPLVRVGGD